MQRCARKIKQVSGCNFDIRCKIVCAHDHTYVCICPYVQIYRLPSDKVQGLSWDSQGNLCGHPPIHSVLPSETCKSSHPGMGNFTVQQPSVNRSLFMGCGSLTGQKCGVPVRKRGPGSGCQGLFYLLYKLWVLWLIVLTFRIVPKWCVCVFSRWSKYRKP